MAKKDGQNASKGQAFVDFVINGIAKGHGFAAALGRADNPSTEYQSWEIIAPWCDLDKDRERLPFTTVGASLARMKADSNGTVPIGRAIAQCYDGTGGNSGNKEDSAKAKLRRLLACRTVDEACRVLRAILKLSASRGVRIDHARLLDDLLWFDPERTLPRWAQDFYGRKGEE